MTDDCCAICVVGFPYQNSAAPENSTKDARKVFLEYCFRVVIYSLARHDGSTYQLEGEHVLAPWQDGETPPTAFPFRTRCWDYTDWPVDTRPRRVLKLGGDKTFDINPRRLYTEFAALHPMQIPANLPHALALECWVIKAQFGSAADHVSEQVNVRVRPTAYMGAAA